MSAETEMELQNLREDLQTLKGDFADLIRSLREDGKTRVEDARMRFWETTQTLGSQAQERLQDLQARGQEAVDSARDHVERRPLTMLFSAFGLGMLIAALMRRD